MMQRTTPRFQFSIASLLAAMVIVSVGLVFWRWDPTAFWMSLGATIAANILGALAALFVTYVLRFPNDGSLFWETKNTKFLEGDRANGKKAD